MAEMTFTCSECNRDLTVDENGRGMQVTCPLCNKQITIPTLDWQTTAPDVGEIVSRFTARISEAAGVEKLEEFSLKDMFSEVFSKHSDEDVERYFAVGSPETTPPIHAVDASWPKPWVFFRTFVIALLVSLGFVNAWDQFGNVQLLPGLIMVGSFAVPFATLLFFFEANVRRNVSLFQVNKLVFHGGIVALSVSLALYWLMGSAMNRAWLAPAITGVVEEPAKLLALFVIIHNRRYPYILNGLLFGAAVGTGFAAFESAGYAFVYALREGADAMKSTMLIRGVLSPFAHIAWTSMCAAALWRVKGSRPFAVAMIKDIRFLRVLIAAVVLHSLWNAGFSLPFYGKYIILGAIAWVVVLGFLQEGLKQLRAEKRIVLKPSQGIENDVDRAEANNVTDIEESTCRKGNS